MENDWHKLTPDDFEEFCWHLLEANGFQNLILLGKSGDRGRDIKASKIERPFVGFEDQRIWVIQCKRYQISPSPSDLSNSIAWALVHKPDYFLLIMPCRISPGTRDWLDGIGSEVPFRIIVLDKPILDSQLLRHFKELGPYLPTEIRETIRKHIVTKEYVPAEEMLTKQPLTTVHMKVLREQAIEPWINHLIGADRSTVVIGGTISIISSTMGSLSIDREVTVNLPKDPTFKYASELFQHLSSGYPKQKKDWIRLKEDFSNYIKEARSVFEAILTKLTTEVSEETGLTTYDFRGPPSNEYFGSKHLSYLIYQDLNSMLLYSRKLFEEDLKINEDKEKSDLFFVSRGAFSRLVQGKKLQCEKVVEIIADIGKDKKFKQLMETLVSKRKELNNHLNKFVEFLEKLSKLIENQKQIEGKCSMCP